MTAHSRLGASGSHRWLECPASYTLESVYPDTTSPAAEQGTLDHGAQERCLVEGLNAKDVCSPGDPPERLAAIQFCVDWVREKLAWMASVPHDGVMKLRPGPAVLLVEHRVSLEPHVPGGFGTLDVAILNGTEAYVIDSKYGRHYVDVVDNSQLFFYAYGLALEFPEIQSFTLVILQPYSEGERARTATYMRERVMAWGERFRQGAEAARANDTPPKPGPWCTFCKATPTCPAYKDPAMLTVRKPPELMSPVELAQAADLAELLSLWSSKVKAHLNARALAGESIPGWELSPGRPGNRNYLDSTTAEATLVAYAEQNGKDLTVAHRVLASPSDIERQLGKSKATKALLDSITTREPPKMTLKRAGVNEMKAAELFPATTSEDHTHV